MAKMKKTLGDMDIPEDDKNMMIEQAEAFYNSTGFVHRDVEIEKAVKDYISENRSVAREEVYIEYPYASLNSDDKISAATLRGYYMKSNQQKVFMLAVRKIDGKYMVDEFGAPFSDVDE